MSADAETEKKICDFLRKNGRSTALVISKEFAGDKKLVNKHLYNLERSNQVFKTGASPPVWDLRENQSGAAGPVESRPTEDSCGQGQLRAVLGSGALTAARIAQTLGHETKAVKKQLYCMMERGQVQKCSKSNLWTLNEEDKTQESDHSLASFSGLSQVFEVIKLLGHGGFGQVYKVKHKFDGKIYAVKQVVLTLKADSEVKALVRLDHPNIVRYITCWPDSEKGTSERKQLSDTSSDVVTFERSGSEDSDDDDDDDEDDDDVTSGMASLSVKASESSGDHSVEDPNPSKSRTYLFIQMEFCEGGTLTSWINARNYMQKQRNTVETNKIFYDIISGVGYIHENKLIHRDLKPDNILFSADGKVKIGDFGLVVVQKNDRGDTIEWSKRRGTPPYMSPEQDNKRNYNEKTDIFSLGLIWFEMLWKVSTGMERNKLWEDLRTQIFPDGFSHSYRTEHQFIKKMLSLSPEDRPRAGDVKLKMEELFSLDQNLFSHRTV